MFFPEKEVKFPFPPKMQPKRFTLDAEDNLTYYGRESLSTLSRQVNDFLKVKKGRLGFIMWGILLVLAKAITWLL